MKTFTLPFSSTTIIRILVALVVILALGTGYFHNQWELSKKKLRLLQNKYETLQDRQLQPINQ